MERTGSGSRALFPKGPSYSLEDFSNKDFIVRDFVDTLADGATPANRRSGPASAPFDPKPLIRTFESTLSVADIPSSVDLFADAVHRCFARTE